MQIYAIKMFNFCRFRENNNTIVFDLTDDEIRSVNDGKTSIDKLYEQVMQKPVEYVNSRKDKIKNIIAISGMKDGNEDFSNGTGKSTILEAICYAFFDKVVRKGINKSVSKEKAGLSIVTKLNGEYPSDLTESYVEILFTEKGKVYKVKRGRSLSKNRESNSPILELQNLSDQESEEGHRKGYGGTGDSLENIINMDFDVFINSLMFGQSDAGKFLTGTDKTKKEMMVSLLHLENAVTGCLDSIREKKNAKIRQLDGSKSQISILEEQLSKKLDIKDINTQITSLKSEIKSINDIISEKELKVKSLHQSDEIKLIEQIKQDGKRIKEELLNKQNDSSKQEEEWKKLLSKAESSLNHKNNECNGLKNKVESSKTNIDKIEKAIIEFKSFNYEDDLVKAQKAKEVKPKYDSMMDLIQKEKNQKSELNGKLVGKIESLTDELNELNKQLKNVEGEEFVCCHCKSKVTKRHIEEEAQKIDKNIKEQNALKTELDNEIKELNQKDLDTQEKTRKINEWILKESQIKSSISDHESKKERLEELKLSREEELKKISILSAEIEDVEKEKKEYSLKIKEIKDNIEKETEHLKIKLNELAQEYKKAEQVSQKIQNDIETINQEISNSRNRVNSITTKIGSMEQEIINIKDTKENLTKIKESIKDDELLLKRLLVLEDVFGLEGIQTHIVKKYIPLLNTYIKEFLDILTQGQISVKLFINDKSQVDMEIFGGTHDTYEMISGGEKMIIRLAVDISLGILSFSRSTTKPEIICLDEIFAPLDNHSTDSVFDLIDNLKDKFNRVILISHKPNINDKLKNKIYVEKESGNKGSSKIKGIS